VWTEGKGGDNFKPLPICMNKELYIKVKNYHIRALMKRGIFMLFQNGNLKVRELELKDNYLLAK